MYTIRKFRSERGGRYKWNYGDYGYDREPGPKPAALPVVKPNPTKLLQRQTMRSVNRNR